MGKRTKLWNIGTTWDGDRVVVIVSDRPLPSRIAGRFKWIRERLKIRALTARAAGRRYIRGNLTFDMASLNYETENINDPDYMKMRPEFLERTEKHGYRRNAVIEVLG